MDRAIVPVMTALSPSRSLLLLRPSIALMSLLLARVQLTVQAQSCRDTDGGVAIVTCPESQQGPPFGNQINQPSLLSRWLLLFFAPQTTCDRLFSHPSDCFPPCVMVAHLEPLYTVCNVIPVVCRLHVVQQRRHGGS